MGKVQDAQYYDDGFATNPHYSIQVTAEKSRHSALYKHVHSLLSPNDRILEIGCGTGQLAKMLIDSGLNYVTGFDFSRVAVKMSKQRTGKDLFTVSDVYEYYFNPDIYDTIIALEVFEHIDNDLDVIGNIQAGKRVIFSLPTFDDAAHVRHFKKAYQITARYSRYFTAWNMVKIGKHHVINAVR